MCSICERASLAAGLWCWTVGTGTSGFERRAHRWQRSAERLERGPLFERNKEEPDARNCVAWKLGLCRPCGCGGITRYAELPTPHLTPAHSRPHTTARSELLTAR